MIQNPTPKNIKTRRAIGRKTSLGGRRISLYSGSLILNRKRRSRKNISRNKKSNKSPNNNYFGAVRSLLIPVSILVAVVYLLLTAINHINAYKDVTFNNPLEDSLAVGNTNIGSGVRTTAILIEETGADTNLEQDNKDQKDLTNQIDHIYLLIWNEDQGKGLVICIPGWVYYPSLYSQTEPLISVQDLGYLSSSLGDSGLMIDELEALSGLNINSYIWIDAKARSFLNETFGEFEYTDDSKVYLERFVSTLSLFDLAISKKADAKADTVGLNTDLNPIEVYNVASQIKNHLDSKELKDINLSNEEFFKPDTLNSGTEVKRLILHNLDDELQEYFTLLRSRTVEKEQAKVEVYNASSVAGLAGDTGRQLRNSGLNLIRAGNSPQELDQTTIYVTKMEDFKNSVDLTELVTKRVLGRHFWSEDKLVKRDNTVKIVNGRPEFLTTGDIVVVLGDK